MREYRIGPGASSLVLIVLVLALTTLGALSIMSAKSEIGLSERTLEMHNNYYAAAARAQDMIAEVDACLVMARRSEGEYMDSVRALLPSWATLNGNIAEFSIDAGAERLLVVQMEILPPESAERYAIRLHSLESVSDEGIF